MIRTAHYAFLEVDKGHDELPLGEQCNGSGGHLLVSMDGAPSLPFSIVCGPVPNGLASEQHGDVKNISMLLQNRISEHLHDRLFVNQYANFRGRC
jgi:hypothetical protein